MFDQYARSLLTDFPEFEGLLADNVARALSRAYLAIIEYRINGADAELNQLADVQPFLRRLANTLIFHVVLDDNQQQTSRQAAAFIAAEAIALTADYLEVARELVVQEPRVHRSAERYARFEASLLYLFARYDACAAGVLREIVATDEEDSSLIDAAATWCFVRLERLCRMALYPPIPEQAEFGLSRSEELTPQELEQDTLSRLFFELGTAVSQYLSWLGGGDRRFEESLGTVDQIVSALSEAATPEEPSLSGHDFSQIYHLAVLLKLVFPSLGERSLFHVVPDPANDDGRYRNYLRTRAVGNNNVSGRPVLWPSAFEYVNECLIGNSRHGVVAMPTGSGKSFVGELAASHALQDGWVLYLAPTNALTEQIRGDLRKGLKELGTEIFAFIGDQEYSIFSTERVDTMPANSVAVMTPEKCALALRLSPEAFAGCRLVVFDECHLIGENNRGPLAELVLTQLMLRTELCRFLFMSAIVQNPEELAEWLAQSMGEQSTPVVIHWRPTRTLRAVLGVDNPSVQENADAAIKTLKTKGKKVRRASFKSACSLAVNLQGPWQSEGEIDYATVRINCEAPLKVLRQIENGKWRYYWEGDSWVNNCAISLATRFTDSSIQTLVFTPANKHYPFNNGKKVRLSQETRDGLPAPSNLVDVCRLLAEHELGVESQVFQLLAKGVSVHTSLMLETEKIGSESMFRSRSAPLMFATGTLAQGLNLPAIAVIIAGSRIGDPRGEAEDEVQRRKFSQLLNAAGRAGRAGFANQGIVVAVPDKPVAFDDFDSIKEARSQVDVLQQYDGAVRVESGLTSFLDAVCANALSSDQASEAELQAISLLVGGDETQIDPLPLLRRTYAAFLRRKHGKSDITEKNADTLVSIAKQFVESTGAPEWLTIAAQRAGLDFRLTLAICQAWGRVRPELPANFREWTVVDWREELLRTIAQIPPGLLSNQIPVDKLKHLSAEFKEFIEKTGTEHIYARSLDWKPPKSWLQAWESADAPLSAWMEGKSIADIARIITGDDADKLSHDRIAGKPIPKALSVCQDIWSSVALIAGGFLAVAEQVLEGDVPLNLASLPMCVKYGCNTPGELAWFRFGVRLRRPSRMLSNLFPPTACDTDEKLRDWVKVARSGWLKQDHDENEILNAIRAFITNG